jgi:2-methylcitrate dehydratase PrpD
MATQLEPRLTADVPAFARELQFDDLPSDVVRAARRHLLDLIGVAASGRATLLSRIIHDHAVKMFGGDSARLIFDGRRASPAGAALAGGMTIDAIDAHDGMRRTKGHIGVAILPALLAYYDDGLEMDGREFLTSLVLGYEIGTRAGIALHASVPDYHTSGAWSCLAVAAIGGRLMGLDREAMRHALGIAEYHGPRSQMMRCIDHPTMLKDGSGWGAMAGVSAAYLAADGFTGAPAITTEADDLAELWADLGTVWYMLDQYVKPYPVCRWAQPAVEATLALKQAHGFEADDITGIEIETFHEATRLAMRHPADTEQAQYSLPFPVASALVKGRLGTPEITGDGLADPAVARISDLVRLVEDDLCNARFPAERLARAKVTLADGRSFAGDLVTAKGDPDAPFDDAFMQSKFRELAEPVIGRKRAQEIEQAVGNLGSGKAGLERLADLVLGPI